jgi:hypothetical protein
VLNAQVALGTVLPSLPVRVDGEHSIRSATHNSKSDFPNRLTRLHDEMRRFMRIDHALA